MPVTIRKKKSGKYSVSTPGGTKAKGTTKEKAEGQAHLLKAIEHGWKPDKAVAKPKKKAEPKKPRSKKHDLRKKA